MRNALCFSILAFCALARAEDFTIQTFAGGGVPQNIQGTSAVLHVPSGIVTDANGNAFFTVAGQNIVLKLDPNGVLTLVAGNGTPGLAARRPCHERPIENAVGYRYRWRGKPVHRGLRATAGFGRFKTASSPRLPEAELRRPTMFPAVNAPISAVWGMPRTAAGNVYVEDPALVQRHSYVAVSVRSRTA